MAKRRNNEGRKVLKSARKRQENCSFITTNAAVSPAAPDPSPTPSLSSSKPLCTCHSKYANLLSLQTLDESTNDGLDITWEDQSRRLCVCHREAETVGNPVKDIFSTVLPPVESPISKQERFPLGKLMSKVKEAKKTQKKDLHTLQALNNLLQSIKSPVQSQDDAEKMKTVKKVTDRTIDDENMTDHCNSKEEEDVSLDRLFTDSNIFEDFAFSPVSVDSTPTVDSTSKPACRGVIEPSTPFRKSVTMRKKLVDKEEDLDCSPVVEDEVFWTQVAVTIDSSDQYPNTASSDQYPNATSGDPLNTDDCIDVDEKIINELFNSDDLDLHNTAGSSIENDSQRRVYSQQDIEKKRALAKRKLHQKIKTV